MSIKRAALCLALAFCLFLCGCASSGNSGQESFAGQAYPLPPGTSLLKDGLRSVLVMGIAYDEQNVSYASTLTLVLLDGEADSLTLVSVPADTRVLLNEYDEDGQFLCAQHLHISQAYPLSARAGLGESATVDAVSALLGGVPLDAYVMLNVVQLRQLSSLTDGVTVNVDSSFAAANSGMQSGKQQLSRRLEEYAGFSSLVTQEGKQLPGTDYGKMARHRSLIRAFLSALADSLAASQDPDALQEEIRNIVRTDLSPEQLGLFISDAAAIDDKAVCELTLPGGDSLLGETSYYLADSESLREWVMEAFYTQLD